MVPKSEAEISAFLEEKGIPRSPREVGIGSQLTTDRRFSRFVNIHFSEGESDEYLARTLQILFAIEADWLVFPRYGKPDDFLEAPNIEEAVAVAISANDASGVIAALVAIQQNLKVIDNDPYLLAASGEILTAWDHHVFSDGFTVRFANIAKSTQFISKLNDFGSEFEVFYVGA